ncbi:MAG: hypothetical protein QXM75_00935 [Candidatus Diapherotrites archaeon]
MEIASKKIIKLLLVGLGAFLITFIVVNHLLFSFAQVAEPQQLASSDKIDLFETAIIIEKSSFSKNLVELQKNSITKITVFNKDTNITHQIILLLPYSDGSYSLVERLSVRPEGSQTFALINHQITNNQELSSKIKPLNEFLISCLTCTQNSNVRLVSAK